MTTTAARPAPHRTGRRVQPLGPDSVTWRYYGDWRGMFVGLWAGSLQNMHPQLGAGVEEHSDFFTERWQRLYRSLYPINGVVYDGDRAEQTAHEVRDYHRTIKGVDRHGRPYSALNPDTFFWAHATFVMSVPLIMEYFGTPLTTAEKEQFYRESIQWYALYGLSMRPVPPDWQAFEAYWDDMCREVLEDNPATRAVRQVDGLSKPPTMPFLPDVVWDRLIGPWVARQYLWMTTGLYHPAVRERLGLTWTDADERRLRRFGRLVGAAWTLVPRRLRLHPRARAGWRRALGKDPADAPLVQTPRRNLPPPDRRGDPKHYCPF